MINFTEKECDLLIELLNERIDIYRENNEEEKVKVVLSLRERITTYSFFEYEYHDFSARR
jgi:hypothetical protein